ncbi:MAG: fumarate reductase subunit C [bacterium]|nr:fumarate reductase subunit C [bacterium]
MNAPHLDRPKVFQPRMPASWWLKHPKYFLFMMRELSSVFIAIFLVVFLVQIAQLPRGPEAYSAFVQKFSAPGWIIFHIVALLFALYHSVTWFEAASKILVIRRGEHRVPPTVITAAGFGAWGVISLVILLLFLFLRS